MHMFHLLVLRRTWGSVDAVLDPISPGGKKGLSILQRKEVRVGYWKLEKACLVPTFKKHSNAQETPHSPFK